MILSLNELHDMTSELLLESDLVGYALTYNKKVYGIIEQEYLKNEEECFKYYISGNNFELTKNLMDIDREEAILKFAAISEYMGKKYSDEEFAYQYDEFVMRILNKGYPKLIDKINPKNALDINECIRILLRYKNGNKASKNGLTTFGEQDATLLHLMIIIYSIKTKDFGFVLVNKDGSLPGMLIWAMSIYTNLTGLRYARANEVITQKKLEEIFGLKTLNNINNGFKKSVSNKVEDIISSIEHQEVLEIIKCEELDDEKITEVRNKLAIDNKSIASGISYFHKSFKAINSSLSNIAQCTLSIDEFNDALKSLAFTTQAYDGPGGYSQGDKNRLVANLIISMAFYKTYDAARQTYLYDSKKIEIEKFIKIKDQLEKKNLNDVKRAQKAEMKQASLEEKIKLLEEKNKKLELENKRLSIENEKSVGDKEELRTLRNYMFSTISEEEVVFNDSDFSEIENKKMVFFGGNSSLHNKLKEVLNNTTFITASDVRFDINMMKNTDRIIIYTDCISHAAYYKIASAISKFNCSAKFICKTRNIALILSEIKKDFK